MKSTDKTQEDALVAAAVDPVRLADCFEPAPDLVVVGTGIRAVGQLTVEAIAHISRADVVFYLVADSLARRIVLYLKPEAISLEDLYEPGKPCRDTYGEMVSRVLDSVRAGRRTCAVFYGHPGIFVDPAHAAIRQAREAGYRAELIPGISAEDCLFADLGIDPAGAGCQTYEAMDFLVNQRRVDPTSHVVIWQVGVLGERTFRLQPRDSSALDSLVERLAETYPLEHEVCVYEASVMIGMPPKIIRLPLKALDRSAVSIISTLHVPPAEPPRFDLGMYFTLSQP